VSEGRDGRGVRPTVGEWEAALEVLLLATSDYPHSAGVQGVALRFLENLDKYRIPENLKKRVTKLLTSMADPS